MEVGMYRYFAAVRIYCKSNSLYAKISFAEQNVIVIRAAIFLEAVGTTPTG